MRVEAVKRNETNVQSQTKSKNSSNSSTLSEVLYVRALCRELCELPRRTAVSYSLQDLGLRSCSERLSTLIRSLLCKVLGLGLLCDSVFLQVNLPLGTSRHVVVGKLVEASPRSTLPHQVPCWSGLLPRRVLEFSKHLTSRMPK